jgi:hypothetical protein
MILSKRERYIAMLLLAGLGFLALYSYGFRPLWDQRNKLKNEILLSSVQVQKANELFAHARESRGQWEQMQGRGLKSDASSAESQLLHAASDWAQDARLSQLSIKQERNEQDQQFQKITYRATGWGNMAAVSRFLWRIETASAPVRLADVQIASRKDGTDDLSVQLGLSVLYLRAESPKASKSEVGKGENKR